MAEYSGSFEPLREAQRNARQMAAGDALWLVYELPATSFDWRGPSLVFESHHAVRRVRAFPPDWRSLADEDLLALSWKA